MRFAGEKGTKHTVYVPNAFFVLSYSKHHHMVISARKDRGYAAQLSSSILYASYQSAQFTSCMFLTTIARVPSAVVQLFVPVTTQRLTSSPDFGPASHRRPVAQTQTFSRR